MSQLKTPDKRRREPQTSQYHPPACLQPVHLQRPGAIAHRLGSSWLACSGTVTSTRINSDAGVEMGATAHQHWQGASGGCPTSLSIFEIHTEANVMAYQDEQGVPWELPSSLEVVLVNDINP